MTRGNQRELARAKNMKKQQKQGKGKTDLKGMSVTQKKESDAAIMRAKQEAAAAAGGKKDDAGQSGKK